MASVVSLMCGGSVVCPVETGRPFAPGRLRLSRRSVAEGKNDEADDGVRGHRVQCNRFPGIFQSTEENPGKPQLGNRRGHLVA